MSLPRSVPAALAAACLLGCAGANTPYPVKGTLRYEDGTPARDLAGGLVTFNSEERKVSAVGPIRDDATYELTTLRDHDGAPAGHYRVGVTPPEPKKGEYATPAPGRPALDPRFRNPETSGLEVTVEKKANDIPLPLARAPSTRRR
jgi:hypothetical protein